MAEARAQGLLEPVRVWRLGRFRVPADQAHLPYTVLGAFPEAEILGQDFGPDGITLRFRIPPGREAALAAAWQDRSRGGRIHWEAPA